MLAELLLSDWPTLRLDTVRVEEDTIILEVHSTAAEACCPLCGQPSDRVHSHYIRHPQDLPFADQRVQWQFHVRRFRCLASDCRRKIFTERLPEVLAAFARRTARLTEKLREIAQALGGESGAQLAAKLGFPTSPDTLLRLIRGTHMAVTATLRVIGIDEWAFRKGRTYGTLIVDLEQHRVVDLLPDCSSERVAAWLQAHPGIEVIARDRSGPFATAATVGAPGAVQVADRWHLLQNVGKVLQRSFERHRLLLEPVRTVPEAPLTAAPATPDLLRVERQAQRQARYDEVQRLYAVGMNKRQIARQVGVSRPTVIRWLNGSSPPAPPGYKHRGRPHGSKLDTYKPYLVERFQAGCHNACALWREIQDQGFDGSRSLVSRFIVRLRRANGDPTAVPPTRRYLYSIPDLVFAVLRKPEDRSEEQQQIVDRLESLGGPVQTACQLTQAFAALVRGQQAEQLDDWLEHAAESELRAFQTFVTGLRRDGAAVRAALSLPWSNGQTEGQINRLKLIKRSMYGRANFDLLRLRVLYSDADESGRDAAALVLVFVIRIAEEP